MMKLITTSAELSTIFLQLLRDADRVRFAVAWASLGSDVSRTLLKAQTKITKSVVGTHFHQTSPDFIEAFQASKNVRFRECSLGIFHPKFYIFETGNAKWACIVGSSNLTNGGFELNNEASILVTEQDNQDGSVIANARAAIDSYWEQATAPENFELDRYRELWAKLRISNAKAAGKFGGKRSSVELEDVDLLRFDWNGYVQQVRKDPHHSIDGRIRVLQAAQDMFRVHGSFNRVPLEDRQGIAGFRETNNIPWTWFGSMQGAGVFKKLVNTDPNGLSAALDEIPLKGDVSRQDYLAFVNRYLQAFPKLGGKPTRHGLGTVTRLLAMKRPDYFVCLDSANRRRLCNSFGIKLDNHEYEEYWDSIVERIMVCNCSTRFSVRSGHVTENG